MHHVSACTTSRFNQPAVQAVGTCPDDPPAAVPFLIAPVPHPGPCQTVCAAHNVSQGLLLLACSWMPQVVFLVTAQAARPLQTAAGTVQLQAADSALAAPVFSAVVSSALRRLMEPEKPTKPNSAKAVDSAAAAFKRLTGGR